MSVIQTPEWTPQVCESDRTCVCVATSVCPRFRFVDGINMSQMLNPDKSHTVSTGVCLQFKHLNRHHKSVNRTEHLDALRRLFVSDTGKSMAWTCAKC
jgi:hypothetical protein